MSRAARLWRTAGAAGCFFWLACQAPPVPLQARLYRAGSPATPLFQGQRLVDGDELFLELELTGSLHVYVFNEDAAGAATLLFPCRGLDSSSRLEAGTVRLPKNLEAARTYWPVQEPTVRERIWVVATERPVGELEKVLAAAPSAAPCAARFDSTAEKLVQDLHRATPRLLGTGADDGTLPAQRAELPAGRGRSAWLALFELSGAEEEPT